MAWCRIAAVSTISVMKVDCPRARSSCAPTRVKMRSTSPTRARAAGTQDPIWASSTISAVCRSQVLLPPMFGPVTIACRGSLAAEMAVVRDERLAAEMRLDHRVTPGDDLQRVALVHLRGGPLVAGGHLRQRQQRVELGQGARRRQEPPRLRRDQRAESRQRLPLAERDLLVGGQDARFGVLQAAR